MPENREFSNNQKGGGRRESALFLNSQRWVELSARRRVAQRVMPAFHQHLKRDPRSFKNELAPQLFATEDLSSSSLTVSTSHQRAASQTPRCPPDALARSRCFQRASVLLDRGSNLVTQSRKASNHCFSHNEKSSAAPGIFVRARAAAFGWMRASQGSIETPHARLPCLAARFH